MFLIHHRDVSIRSDSSAVTVTITVTIAVAVRQYYPVYLTLWSG